MGVAYKDDMNIFDEIDANERSMDDRVCAKEKRAKIFEFAYKAAHKMSQRVHLLQSSYTNFGLYLPMDGSKDDDVSTLHANGRYNRYANATDSEVDDVSDGSDE